MPNPDDMPMPSEETRRWIEKQFEPQPREMPDFDERFRELERRVREPA